LGIPSKNSTNGGVFAWLLAECELNRRFAKQSHAQEFTPSMTAVYMVIYRHHPFNSTNGGVFAWLLAECELNRRFAKQSHAQEFTPSMTAVYMAIYRHHPFNSTNGGVFAWLLAEIYHSNSLEWGALM